VRALALAALFMLAGCAEVTTSAPSEANIPIAPHLKVQFRTGLLHLNTRHIHIEPHVESSVPLSPGASRSGDITRFEDLGAVIILHWEF